MDRVMGLGSALLRLSKPFTNAARLLSDPAQKLYAFFVFRLFKAQWWFIC
jgi:hypothetical protein